MRAMASCETKLHSAAGSALFAPAPEMLWENCNVQRKTRGAVKCKNYYLAPSASNSFYDLSSVLVKI